MLTIDEIKDVTFRKGRGYKDEDVDAFIDEVIVSFEHLKKEKADLVRKMDILATRVEQYRADEETVRNALLSSQRVADSSIKEANAKAASIVAEAEAKAQKMLREANEVTATQKDVYLKLKKDSVKLREELEALYNNHLKTLEDLPTDAVIARNKKELDEKYPTTEVEAEPQPVAGQKPVEQPTEQPSAQPTVQPVAQPAEPASREPVKTIPVIEDVPASPDSVEYVKSDESKFSDLKFGENYDVDAD